MTTTTTSSPARPRRRAHAAVPATRRKPRTQAGVPLIWVADPWTDWRSHMAALNRGRIIPLWDEGGRPIVLAKCGLLAQIGSLAAHTERCPGCLAVHQAEQRAVTQARHAEATRQAVAA